MNTFELVISNWKCTLVQLDGYMVSTEYNDFVYEAEVKTFPEDIKDIEEFIAYAKPTWHIGDASEVILKFPKTFATPARDTVFVRETVDDICLLSKRIHQVARRLKNIRGPDEVNVYVMYELGTTKIQTILFENDKARSLVVEYFRESIHKSSAMN
jgi:hypothetical protein